MFLKINMMVLLMFPIQIRGPVGIQFLTELYFLIYLVLPQSLRTTAWRLLLQKITFALVQRFLHKILGLAGLRCLQELDFLIFLLPHSWTRLREVKQWEIKIQKFRMSLDKIHVLVGALLAQQVRKYISLMLLVNGVRIPQYMPNLLKNSTVAQFLARQPSWLKLVMTMAPQLLIVAS